MIFDQLLLSLVINSFNFKTWNKIKFFIHTTKILNISLQHNCPLLHKYLTQRPINISFHPYTHKLRKLQTLIITRRGTVLITVLTRQGAVPPSSDLFLLWQTLQMKHTHPHRKPSFWRWSKISNVACKEH